MRCCPSASPPSLCAPAANAIAAEATTPQEHSMTFHRTVLAAGLVALAFGANAQQAARQTYIVQLADAPAATYGGTVAGYPATRPATGAKLDVNASNVRAY